MNSDHVEQALIDAKLVGYLTKDPSDDQPAYQFRTNEQAARRALEAIPDGWAKVNGVDTDYFRWRRLRRIRPRKSLTCQECNLTTHHKEPSINHAFI